jgi:hypothetical protein
MTTDVPGIHRRLFDALDEAMGVAAAQWGKIRVLSRRTLNVEVQRGFSETFLQAFGSIGIDDALPATRALSLGRRVSVPNMADDACAEEYRAVARSEGFRAMQTTPLVASNGEPLGTLSTCFADIYVPSTSVGLVLDHCAARAARIVENLLLAGHSPR